MLKQRFFGDNAIDRKSLQDYVMKFFGKLMAWKTNKQDTVTIFFIKVKLLTILQIAKKAIYFSRLMKALKLFILETLTIKCNNAQII